MVTMTKRVFAALAAVSALPFAMGSFDAAFAKDKVKIAFVGPLTGALSPHGIGGRNSAELAVKLMNADPKTKYDYELVVLDDECKPNIGVQVVTKIASDRSIVAAVPHYCSATAIATVDIFNRFKLPMVVWAAVLPEITYANKYPEVHRVSGWGVLPAALIGRPKLVLLDEPSAGMTHDETEQVVDEILGIRKALGGLAIIIVEHEMGLIERVTDRCVVLIAFSAIVDLLRLAADEGDRSRPDRCSWSILAPDLNPVTASCGLQVLPWETFDSPERFDYIVVVGGLIDRNSTYHPKTLEFLRAAAAKSVAIAGICTGSFALVEAQLMRGRKCCVSWYHLPDLIERYGDIIPVADQLFVEDGKFITCAGGLAALDLGAWMVERHLGPGRAQKSLHIMVTDAARPAGGAQPQPPSVGAVDDPRVRRAMLQIEQNLSTPQKVDHIAHSVGLSKRQLERIFRKVVGKSIQEFSRDLRVFYGLWLLANSDKTITTVAIETGFSDISHFNRLFRASFGRAPSALRREGPDAMKALISRWQAAQPTTLNGLHATAKRQCQNGMTSDPAVARLKPPMPASDLKGLGFLSHERRPYV